MNKMWLELILIFFITLSCIFQIIYNEHALSLQLEKPKNTI